MSNSKRFVVAAMLFAAGHGYAHIVGTSASVRLENSLIVDIQVRTRGNPAQLFVRGCSRWLA